MVKFNDMKYVRPNIDEVLNNVKGMAERLSKSESFDEVKEIFLEYDKLERSMQTMQTLVSIRNSINVNDEFYKEEKAWWDEKSPLYLEVAQMYIQAILSSKYLPELKKEFGDVYFDNLILALKSFSPEIIEELQTENKLTNEYDSLIAKAKVDFNGKSYTLAQLTKFKTSANDDERTASWIADGKWYQENGEKLDEIYDKLTHLRDQMGKKLGYENYIQLGYYRMNRNCYDQKMIEKFRENVVKYIVPLANKTYEDQAKRINKSFPLSYADQSLHFVDGNPRPVGTPEDILKAGKKFYDDLSEETSKFFNMMLENDLLDVLSKEGKQAGGYCTGLPDYHVPFIFANFNGTQHDVEVVTHEAGHAFECYMNESRVPLETVWPSMEACEVHSMSMEFFAWSHVEDFFGKDANKYKYSHLAGALQFIPYGTMVDHFQHIVYEHPEYTPAKRHEEWKRLSAIYMPWIKLDGEIPFYSEGRAWQRQLHIYDMPFYYIDYCLAQTVALEFWAMIQEDPKNAWEHYMAYTKLGGSMTFVDLLKSAKLDTPFDENCLKKVSEVAWEWLNNFDMKSLTK